MINSAPTGQDPECTPVRLRVRTVAGGFDKTNYKGIPSGRQMWIPYTQIPSPLTIGSPLFPQLLDSCSASLHT